MTLRTNQMDQLSALYDLVKRYPGGVPAMAARLPGKHGNPMSAPTLYAILRGDEPLIVERQDAMIHFCRQAKVEGWSQPLHAKAHEHGCILIEEPMPTDNPDALSMSMIHAVKEFGELAAEAATDIADGQITRTEMREIERIGYETVAAIVGFIELCREQNLKPMHRSI